MKAIPLSQGKFAIVDDDDFDRISQHKWYFNIYAVRTKNRKTFLMHREILNPRKGMETDHINGDKLDNRKSNLRECTRKQNEFNKPQPKTNKTGFKGVHYVKPNRNFAARISINNRPKHLGNFPTAEEAAVAYSNAAIALHGDFVHRPSLIRKESL